MVKRGIALFVFLSLILIANVIAQETVGTDEAFLVDEGGELGVDAGITPDSAFYFIDNFFDRFGNGLENREEKIAEIKQMISEGKIEAAREALEKYKEYADEVEKEVSPEEREEAERGVRAIKRAVKELENEIPEDERGDFVADVIEKEGRIQAAAEIAAKIKELCGQLAKLDPSEYARVCKTKDDDETPKWQKKLDKDLTDEQKKDVKTFVGIMSQCFETSGRQCRCEDISIESFADKCSVIAPLAAKCDNGDENACKEMEEVTSEQDPFELLPDYLREAVLGLENEFDEDSLENHMPSECREKGARNPKECMKIMFEIHAPEECRAALERGEISFDNEHEARKTCEEIMFRENAPEECINAGITNPRECGTFMFKQNAPSECIEAGLTGEQREDPRKCERLMREKFGEGRGVPGHAAAFGFRCKEIQNPEERLKCFDSALAGIEGGFEGSAEGFNKEGSSGQWPEPCQKAQAFTQEFCKRIMEEFGAQQQKEGEFKSFEGQPSQCQAGQIFRCDSNGRCGCEGEPTQTIEGFVQPQCGEGQFLKCSSDGKCECVSQETTTTTSGETSTETTTNSGSGESGTSGTSSSGTTGSVIFIDNSFLDYYWG